MKFNMTVELRRFLNLDIVYDTSFLKQKQVVINGDVESNPGPISSIQAHRAAIGRFYGKARIKNKFENFKGTDFTIFLFILTLP